MIFNRQPRPAAGRDPARRGHLWLANTRRTTVRCRRVTKCFGEGEKLVWALSGVDLTVSAGELTLLVGPSGCGKSTLLSVVAGLLDPTAGKLNVLGRGLPRMSDAERVTFRLKNVGFVFQSFHLLPALDATENVMVPLLLAGWKHRAARKRALELIDRVRLGERSANLPAEMSMGQQQRVAIARALVHEPQLVICDEPTSALDHKNGESVMRLLAQAATDKNRAVLVVTHDERLRVYAQRIATMEDGRIRSVEGSSGAASMFDNEEPTRSES